MQRIISGPNLMDPSTLVADRLLDITGEICPMTYVRTRLALDRMAPGQILAVRLRGADPARNVPRSAARQGHQVVSQHEAEDGTTLLQLRCKCQAYPRAPNPRLSVSASDPSL